MASQGSFALREAVHSANQLLVDSGLVMGTFGNVSAVDRDAGVFVIKPSGVPYDELTPDHMVSVSLETGEVVDGEPAPSSPLRPSPLRPSHLRPSSDTPTHLALYRAFSCGGIAHTHSESATALAQARRAIPCTGTTHADYFRGDIPVTRPLRRDEVEDEYERNTGLVIVETFRDLGMTDRAIPGVLVANHGPFAWGDDAFAAVEHARILEYVARLEILRCAVAPDGERAADFLIEKHYNRKHGSDAYYGQP